MAKISKRLLGKHNQAIEMLKQETVSFDEREFIYDHYHEGAGKMNNLISAHFTPYYIAKSMTFNIAYEDCFIDLCAGIGMLSYVILRQNEMGYRYGNPPLGICIENCTEYYEVGKKLLPEFHWINGDIFDPKVIGQVNHLLKDRKKKFSIISNPPYGSQVKTDTKDLLKYNGATFEYKAMELGAILGAYDAAFLIPQQSAPFRITGQRGNTFDESYKTPEYNKFVKQTGIQISANNGFDTSYIDDDIGGNWKDVNIVTEIACIDYCEVEYNPIRKQNANTMFWRTPTLF